MPIRIKARQNESVGQMLRRFKKLCEKEGLTKDIKRRQYFEKPSERRRRAHRKSIQRLARMGMAPTGGGGGGGGGGGRGRGRGPGGGGTGGPSRSPGRSSGPGGRR